MPSHWELGLTHMGFGRATFNPYQMSVIVCIHKLQRIEFGIVCAHIIQWSKSSHPRERSLEDPVLMLMAGYSTGLKHCAFKRDEDTSLGVEPGPKSQVLGHCQGLPLWRPGLCGSGLQPGTWHRSGPAPYVPLPHDSALAPVSSPPTHTPTRSLCGLSEPSVDSYHLQTLQVQALLC